MEKIEKRLELKQRLLSAKAELLRIGVVDKPLIRFMRKYPELDYNKVRNFWYGKSINIDFIVKLESFVEFCKVNYE